MLLCMYFDRAFLHPSLMTRMHTLLHAANPVVSDESTGSGVAADTSASSIRCHQLTVESVIQGKLTTTNYSS